jgi:hypothetical protein
MCRVSRVLLGAGVLALALSTVGTPVLRAQEPEGSIVIILKDGRRQSFRLADVARIEFEHSAATASAGSVRFAGRWKVGVGGGVPGSFDIILKPDGTAHKTIDGGGDGTWVLADGEARIAWKDGWHDVIRKQGNKYQKVAFIPGTSFDQESTNVASAEYQESQ